MGDILSFQNPVVISGSCFISLFIFTLFVYFYASSTSWQLNTMSLIVYLSKFFPLLSLTWQLFSFASARFAYFIGLLELLDFGGRLEF